MQVLDQKNGLSIVNQLEIADSYFARLAGLMFRTQLKPGSGLLILPCKQIHTHFMRFAIDALFLDRHNVVVHIERELKPWRFTKYINHANAVLELPSGRAHLIKIGDQMQIMS